MTPVAEKVKTATHWRRVFALTVFGALMLAALAFANSGRAAIETPPPPSVWSDKADYAPGEQVSLSGANWAPGESVHIRVNDDAGETWRRDVDVTADESGAISDQFNLPDWFVAQYSVTATGASGTATWSFTDGTLDFQLATAGNAAPSNVTWSINWDVWQGTGITANNNCNGARTSNGTATYTGNILSSGTRPGINNNASAKPTSAQSTGSFAGQYELDYWSSTASSTTPLTSTQICQAGVKDRTVFTLYAHFKLADATAPTTTIQCNAAACVSSFYNANVSVTLAATDNAGGSGVKEIRYTTDGSTPTASDAVSPNGTTYSGAFTVSATATVKYRAFDNAGNAEAVKSQQVNIDKVAPTLAITGKLSGTSTNYASGTWTNQDVDVHFACSDTGGAGVKASSVPADETASATKSYSETCMDEAGNTSAAATFQVNIDKVAPTLAITGKLSGTSTNYASGTWTNQDVDVHFACSDTGGAGVKASSVPADETASATKSYSETCMDEAGNTSAAATFQVNIDKVAPTLAITASSGTSTNYASGHLDEPGCRRPLRLLRHGRRGRQGEQRARRRDGERDQVLLGDLHGRSRQHERRGHLPGQHRQGRPDARDHGQAERHLDQLRLRHLDEPGCRRPLRLLRHGRRGRQGEQRARRRDGERDQVLLGDLHGRSRQHERAATFQVNIDKVAPTLAITGKLSGTSTNYASGTWTNQDVDVHFACSDTGGAGVKASSVPADETASATKSYSETCMDEAGNTSAAATFQVNIDKVAPTLAITGKLERHLDQLRLRHLDEPGCRRPLRLLRHGRRGRQGEQRARRQTASATKSYSETCMDEAGNTSAAATFQVNIDKVAPTLAITGKLSGTSTNYASGTWTNQDVDVHFACSDTGGAGVKASSVPADETASATKSYSETCMDEAGNTSAAATFQVNIDKVAPTITFDSVNPSPNADGWNKDDVTVKWNCSDSGGSGLVAANVTKAVTGEGSALSATGTSDNAGNETSDTHGGIKIDRNKPEVTVTGVSNGATYTLGSVPAAGCSTSDGLSGVKTAATLSSSGGPVGSITASCNGAEDKAGNTNSASATYQVNSRLPGFFAPVDNNNVCNIAKAGSAIPVKFTLHGDQGLNIFAAGYPKATTGTCSASMLGPPLGRTMETPRRLRDYR